MFRQLVALRMLEVDHQNFGALRIAEASRPVLKGEQMVMLRKQGGKRAARVRSKENAVTLDPAGSILWESLRAWRTETAKQNGVPAFVIFHDTTLRELARACPDSWDRLRATPGIGAAKLGRYGAALLAICRAHKANFDMVENPDPTPN